MENPLICCPRGEWWGGGGNTPGTRQSPSFVFRAIITYSGVASHDLGRAGWKEQGRLFSTEKMSSMFVEVSVQHSCSSCVQNQVFLFTCIIDSVTIICGNCSPLGFDTNGVLFACLLSRVWLFCDPMDCSLPGSYVHGISQVRILEWVSISLSRGSFWHRHWTHNSYIGRWIPYHWATREIALMCIMYFKVQNPQM